MRLGIINWSMFHIKGQGYSEKYITFGHQDTKCKHIQKTIKIYQIILIIIRNLWASSNRIKPAQHDFYHRHSTVKSMEDLCGTCWFSNFCRTITTHWDHQIYHILIKTKPYTVRFDWGIGLSWMLCVFIKGGFFQ